MTFEEVMGGEHIGVTSFSPDGRAVAVQIERADAPTHGVSLGIGGSRTEVWDLATRRRRVVGGGLGYQPVRCSPWAAHGRGLVLLTSRRGSIELAYWQASSGRVTTFAPSIATLCPFWWGERLVYVTDASGLPGRGDSVDARALYQLARWRRARSGAAAEVTSHSANPIFPSPPPREGALVLADPATGRSRVLDGGTFHTMVSSPDGRLLAAVRLGRPDAKALYSPDARDGELRLYRRDGSQVRGQTALPGYDVDYQGLAWSRDSRELLVGARRVADDRLVLLVLSRDGGLPRAITLPSGVSLGAGRRASSTVLRPIGWVAGRPAFIAAVREHLGEGSDLTVDYGESRGIGFRLFVETARGAEAISGPVQQSVLNFATTPDGTTALFVADGTLWAAAPGRGPRRVSSARFDVASLADARPDLGIARIYAVSDRRAAVNVRSPNGERRVVLDLQTGVEAWSQPTKQIAAMSPHLDVGLQLAPEGWASRLQLVGDRGGVLTMLNAQWRDRPVGAVDPVEATVKGRVLRSWVVLPPNYAGGRLPALVWIYGGQLLSNAPPPDASPLGGTTPVFEAQLWAAQGYAVIFPSTPIGAGADSDLMSQLAEETLAAVDAAAEKGWVDPARVGIIGHSFGGYSTAAVLAARSDRFKAGIAMSGVYDYAAAWGAPMPADVYVDQDSHSFSLETRAYVELGQAALMRPPWEAPGRYQAVSPFYHAAQIKTPLLLTVGDLDLGPTSLIQADRFYAALRRTGNPAVLVRYWGERHVQDDPSATRDQWHRFTAWFSHYLGTASKPRGG
jgi:dipeptidyl aminopeptidase/acylaminoacyl peptidase